MGTSQEQRTAVISFTGAARKDVSRETLSQRVPGQGEVSGERQAGSPTKPLWPSELQSHPCLPSGKPKPV